MQYIPTKYMLAGLLLFCLAISISACKKQDAFLDAKPNISYTVPSTLADFQLLIQYTNVFNNIDFGLPFKCGEQFHISDVDFLQVAAQDQNAYLWKKDMYPAGSNVSDWSSPYSQIYYANIVLDGLSKISPPVGQQVQFNAIKGSALFFRAKALFNLLQVFTLPYDSTTADSDMGIPIRLSSDLNIKSRRGTVQEGYDRVIADLKEALTLVPITASNSTLPSQAAVNGWLARVYLTAHNYTDAFNYADAALHLYSSLTDYNTLNIGSWPFSTTPLSETIFLSTGSFSIRFSLAQADTALLNSYDSNDLRKNAYFRVLGVKTFFYGFYDVQTLNPFTGLATDELYLIRAECYARKGNTTAAMSDLNTLLEKRWKTGTFVPYTATDANDALRQVLQERQKELAFRGLRWQDVRRLSKDPQWAITLSRTINGQTYTLAPGSLRYACPIPDNEIQASGIPQNP